MFYFPSLFRGNSFNAPATTDNKERNQSEEKTPPDTDYPEPLDPASLKKIAHMEDSKKLNLLKFKWKPEENFKFPSRNSRRYNPRWECDFPWLRYSKSEDSVYCGYCLVFAKSGCFSTSGYIDWKNAVGDKRGNFKKHEQCKQHQDAQQQATEFLRVCDSKERKDVYSFLSTAFIVSLVSSQYLLGFTRNLTDSLQESNCDLVKAFSDARNTRTVIISKRTNEDFEKIFERARIVAQSVDCSLEIPRQVARQQHRANAPATTPCEYWRINLFFPFIDHLMTQFDERFPESSRNMYLGYYLIPKYLPQLDDEKLKAIRESYQADLPQFHSFEQELLRWRNMTRKFDVNNKYPLQTALKIADKEFFPNLHAILSSILTLPVGSVCCERSFSSLRRLKRWERSTMGQERLCGLALLHIHKDKVDSTEGFNERVLKRWDATGHRKIGKLWNKEQENSE